MTWFLRAWLWLWRADNQPREPRRAPLLESAVVREAERILAEADR